MASSTDQCHDLRLASRPHIGVATSTFALNSFFHLKHIFLVATSLTGLGDIVTWKSLNKRAPCREFLFLVATSFLFSS